MVFIRPLGRIIELNETGYWVNSMIRDAQSETIAAYPANPTMSTMTIPSGHT
jgi:hypothetical protein